MKKFLFILLMLLLAAVLTACSQREGTATSESSTATTVAATATATAATTAAATEEKTVNKITLNIGDSQFTATLYDNETAKELASRLPLTLNLQELHGNEKYYYFDSPLPSDATVPDRIHAGDIKLYGSDCLVLFYDSFTTAYSYTDIGEIDNPDGLKEALGTGDVIIIFAADEP